jgi:hypothetical protein
MTTLMDTARADPVLLLERIKAITNMTEAEHRTAYEANEGSPLGLSLEMAVWYVPTGTPFNHVAILNWSYVIENPDFDEKRPYDVIENCWLKMLVGSRYIIEGDMGDLVEIGKAKWEELQRTRPWEE